MDIIIAEIVRGQLDKHLHKGVCIIRVYHLSASVFQFPINNTVACSRLQKKTFHPAETALNFWLSSLPLLFRQPIMLLLLFRQSLVRQLVVICFNDVVVIETKLTHSDFVQEPLGWSQHFFVCSRNMLYGHTSKVHPDALSALFCPKKKAMWAHTITLMATCEEHLSHHGNTCTTTHYLPLMLYIRVKHAADPAAEHFTNTKKLLFCLVATEIKIS